MLPWNSSNENVTALTKTDAPIALKTQMQSMMPDPKIRVIAMTGRTVLNALICVRIAILIIMLRRRMQSRAILVEYQVA
jgi:hypothetical protein